MLVSFFWATVFLFGFSRKNIARIALGIFMTVQVIVYFCHGLFFLGTKGEYVAIDALYNFAGLSSYPMYYLYIRLLSCDTRFKYYYIWHLAPAFLLSLLLQIGLLIMDSSEKTTYLSNAVMFRKYPEKASQAVYITCTIFFITRIVFAFQVIFYLAKSYLLVKKYNERIQNFYSNTEGKELIWAKTLLISLMIASAMSLIVNSLGRGFFTGGKEHNLVLIPALLFSILLFFLGLQGYKQNHNVTDFESDRKDKYRHKKSTYEKKLLEKLEELIMQNHYFLDKNLNIVKVSKLLKTNRSYISHIINEEYKMSFSDFINQFRVNYAKQLIEQDTKNRYSLDYISEESGFGSFSSFNRAFKKFEKKTANTFRKKLFEKNKKNT